jgi:sterol 3beta-glucosyltransferase
MSDPRSSTKPKRGSLLSGGTSSEYSPRANTHSPIHPSALGRKSLDYPERLRFTEADQDEDVTAPKKDHRGQWMGQSVFSMITAAGSKVDFNSRFENESSESDNDGGDEDEGEAEGAAVGTDSSADERGRKFGDAPKRKSSLKDKIGSTKLMRSLPNLSLRGSKDRKKRSGQALEAMPEQSESSNTAEVGFETSALTTAPAGSGSRASPREDFIPLERTYTPRDAPVMSRMLQAKEQYSKSEIQDEVEAEQHRLENPTEGLKPTALSERLMEIFALPGPEEVQAGRSSLS